MDTTLIYKSNSEIQISGAIHILNEEGIQAFTLNKKDSAYAGILGGEIELYVYNEEENNARNILAEKGFEVE